MSHPMEGYYDGMRSESDRRWARIRAMRMKLAKTPLSEFTADYTFAICLVLETAILDDIGRHRKIEEALEKLELFYKKRRENRKKRVDPRYPTGKAPK